ncbi:conserved Plasmodium protein, unknown function [Plasmodium gaboni]|uniref:Uncharacterized protein n=1 Tax=Plasmodium gaboni TaxID=647221 RepID=A0ABY1UTT2_9APIC|nr:conserved Plasmodium protein, unknown function [Plasmodium gaboni]
MILGFFLLNVLFLVLMKNNLCLLKNKRNVFYPINNLSNEKKKKIHSIFHKRNNGHTIIKLFIINNTNEKKQNYKKKKNKEYFLNNKKNRNDKVNILYATQSNFFNPKQFKDLLNQDAKEKTKNVDDGDDCLELENVENLEEIAPELHMKLMEYKKSEESKDEEINEKKIEDVKDITLYEGLPLLMIEGEKLEGFADTRKVKIKPEISTPFTNDDYNEYIKSSMGEKMGNPDANQTKINEKHDKNIKKENNSNTNEELNKFEKDIEYILNVSNEEKKKKREMDKNEEVKKSDELTKEGKIERYKKVGTHYYMDSSIGKILYDRNYPGYAYINHGENINEINEKSEFDSSVPSYLNPSNVHLRTGRKREEQKKKDSGIKQKRRWNVNNISNDIKRGNWKYYDDTVKDLIDSIDQEKLDENYYSNNYYQRSHNNTGYGGLEKVQNNYFDVQFIGSAETYPANISVGMNFIWPINFVPLLSKQYTKRLGQPIKSPIFNLGGFDHLQLWYYPDGMNNSMDGYCSLKLMMKPGSYLPVKIFLFAFSEYNYIHTKAFYKESADYVISSSNLCKCLLKTKENLKNIENNKDYVILGPAGNIYIGVGIYDDNYDFEEDFKKFYSINNKYKNKKNKNQQFKYKYDWDEGVHIFDNWLKKQSAVTDDKDELLPSNYTHSELYENYKYKYVPEKNPFKFLRSKNTKQSWNRHPF